MPTRVCDWAGVLVFVCPVPYFAVDIRVHQGAGGAQFGRRGFRAQRDGGSFAFVGGRFGPSVGMNPGSVGFEDCEILFTHLRTKEMIAEMFLARRFLSIQRAFEAGDLENVYWPPDTENPADGLTKVRSEKAPLLRLLESGRFNPGSLRPLKGAACME